MVREALGLPRPSLPAAICIEETIMDGSVPILGNASQIHEVLMNICTNAPHAMSGRGTLSVRSTPGRGTRFDLCFPETRNAAADFDLAVDSAPSPPSRVTVLFVDDEPMITRIGRDMLGGLGYRIRAFTDPESALSCFSSEPDAFDVVITDLTMPGLNGEELAERIIRVRPKIPVIICTGYSGVLDEARARACGITRLLHKPLSRAELSRAIEQALHRNPAETTAQI